ncbi:MAG: GNAT family N-acetyltransferase [Paracoccaceae bacterium]
MRRHPEVTVRPMVMSDLDLVIEWLCQPHLKPYYVFAPVDREEARTNLCNQLSKSARTRAHIAEADGVPYGHVQWYLTRAFPSFGAARLGIMHGYSIDYFIGEPAALGQRLGPRMLENLVDWVMPRLPEEDRVAWIAHDPQNMRAIRCTKRAGFCHDRYFFQKGQALELFRRDG